MPNSSPAPNLLDPDAMARQLMQRAHNRDGLPEIAVGSTFLLVSGLVYAQAALAFAILVPALCFGLPSLLNWTRSRYLVRRLGYVQHKPISGRQVGIGITIGVLTTAAMFGVVTSGLQPDAWVLAGTGIVGGALEAVCGRMPRFIIGGALMAATGLIVALSGVPLDLGFAIIFGLQGLVTLASGCLVFLRFIRLPVQAPE
jgi:hypothetical protein